MTMKIHFLIIGNEILKGKIQDANGHFLAKLLVRHHLELGRITVAPDRMEELVELIRKIYQEADIIISSGGLGPTGDDITKEAFARALKRPVRYHEGAFNMMVDHYQRFKRPAQGKDHPYAFMPDGFLPVFNPCGLASGLHDYDSTQKKLVLCAPGVPREFQSMVEQEFLPIISKAFPLSSKVCGNINFRTRFQSEEKIFQTVAPGLWDELASWGEVCSLPHVLGVDIGVALDADSEVLLASKREAVRQIIRRSPIAPHVWQEGDLSLPQFIVNLALSRKATFTFAESCTGGLISSLITDIPGSSEVFRGGAVTYQTGTKEKVLLVSTETLITAGVVSPEVAVEMAKGVRALFRSDMAFSITGLTGPTHGDADAKLPIGTAAIGIAGPGRQEKTLVVEYQGDRKRLKEVFAFRVLHALLDELNSLEELH